MASRVDRELTLQHPVFRDVSRETFAALDIYEAQLNRWRRVKNLVAPSTLDHLWQRHFLDSAQLLKLRPKAQTWVDLGSGAGFPGLVIAILLMEFGSSEVHLVESDHRKCAFLREVTRMTGARAKVHHGRIEDVIDSLPAVEIVTARALAPMPELLRMAKPLLDRGSEGLFLKGQHIESELTKDPIFSMVKLKYIQSLTSPKACIVSATRHSQSEEE